MIQYDPHRWLDHLFDVKGSLIIEITWRVLACLVWAGIVVALERRFGVVAIPETAHTLIGAALGLLLVFRTNSSYERFWEGRKLWGSLINESRNLARGALVHLKGDPELLESVIRWTGAFPYATMHVLRDNQNLGPIAARLPRADLESVLQEKHPAMAVSVKISECLVSARDKGLISDYVLMSLDQNVQLLIDYLGGCERIHKTPIPYAYMVHLRRLLLIYCLTLPIVLIDRFGWFTLPATVFVAYTLFGIEEIGVEIEDPFGHDLNDLPLDQFCATIEANLLALINRGEEAVPPVIVD
jgi:putative membrane protein